MKSMNVCRDIAGKDGRGVAGGVRRDVRGFTLIEIMVVVAIITVLASIALFMGIQLKRSSGEKQTRAALEVLVGAMNAYIKDNPEPPPLGTTTDETSWVMALKSFPASANMLKSLKFSDDGSRVLDGFSNPIIYIRPNTPLPNQPTGQTTGVFMSAGPDGLAGPLGSKASEDNIFSTGTAP